MLEMAAFIVAAYVPFIGALRGFMEWRIRHRPVPTWPLPAAATPQPVIKRSAPRGPYGQSFATTQEFTVPAPVPAPEPDVKGPGEEWSEAARARRGAVSPPVVAPVGRVRRRLIG